MKRILNSVLLFALAVLMLAAVGCKKTVDPVPADVTEAPEAPTAAPEEPTAVPEEPTEAPEEPTEAPEEPTEAPEEPTEAPEEPTEAPAEPRTGSFIPFAEDEPIRIDMDGDGRDDTVLITTEEDEYDCIVPVATIKLAADPEHPFVYRAWSCWRFSAAVTDCDVDDSRRELILGIVYDSNDYSTFAIRFRDDGCGFDVFEGDFEFGDDETFNYGFPEGTELDPEVGLPCEVRTEILGTNYVKGHFTVTADGIEYAGEEFLYPEYEGAPVLELTKELEIETENGAATLPVGTEFRPYSTDLFSWVKIVTADGTEGVIKIEFAEDGWPITIGGVPQDEYALIPYAD